MRWKQWNSSPKFLLTKPAEDSKKLPSKRICSEAFLDLSLKAGLSFLFWSSSSSSHKLILEVRSTSSRAPLDLAILSLVKTSAIIRGWGAHLTTLLDFLNASKMMAISTAVLRSWREVMDSFRIASYNDFASVIKHSSSLDRRQQSSFRTATKGTMDFLQSSLCTSPYSTSRIISCSHSTSANAWLNAKASPAKVEETLLFNFADLQDRMETLARCEAEGSRSEARITQAPCTVSSNSSFSPSNVTGALATPPASEAAMRTILLRSNLCRTKGWLAVFLMWWMSLFKQLTSWMEALLRREDNKLTIPAASGLVWWASQLTRYNIDRYSSKRSVVKEACLSPSMPLGTFTWCSFSVMYFSWDITTLSLVKVTVLPAKSAESNSHFPKTNLSLSSFWRIGWYSAVAAMLKSSTSSRIMAMIWPPDFFTSQHCSNNERSNPMLSKNSSTVWCHRIGASSNP